ncbi:MAG: glycerophosphodiester phosphodiesterase family protein [Gammaproteobacteria bacterium]
MTPDHTRPASLRGLSEAGNTRIRPVKNMPPILKSLPDLVAHRGDMTRFPENSLAAIGGAVKAGARYVEFDIQLSKDLIPMLLHDGTLHRTTQGAGEVWDYSAVALNEVKLKSKESDSVNFLSDETPGDENRSSLTPLIPTLAQCVELLNRSPHVTAFVELKHESMDHFGMEVVVDSALETLRGARFPWVLISFVDAALRFAATQRELRIGWVLPEYSPQTRDIAMKLVPDFLFCDQDQLPGKANDFWPGPWQWAVYAVDEPAVALALHEQGANLIETNRITDMLRAAPFKEAR